MLKLNSWLHSFNSLCSIRKWPSWCANKQPTICHSCRRRTQHFDERPLSVFGWFECRSLLSNRRNPKILECRQTDFLSNDRDVRHWTRRWRLHCWPRRWRSSSWWSGNFRRVESNLPSTWSRSWTWPVLQSRCCSIPREVRPSLHRSNGKSEMSHDHQFYPTKLFKITYIELAFIIRITRSLRSGNVEE